MASYALNLTGRIPVELSIDVHWGIETASAWALAFNDDADVVGETESTRYSGFCDSEIMYAEAHRVIAGRWGIESQDIATAIGSAPSLVDI